MIYSILKFLFRVTLKVFFKRIEVKKEVEIPDDSPLIIVANHPSTFMDPIVIASLLKKKVFFLAKGEVFKSGFAKWLLPHFNMIPVYRKQDDPTQMQKNEETFETCFSHLAVNGTILIFPEGVSVLQRKLEKIKTGTARIALGAEAANQYSLDVKILVIGLNYSNPGLFRSNLFVNIGKPIDVSDFYEGYKKDAFRTVQLLTEEIRVQLETLIIAIDDGMTDELVKDIETIYKKKLLKETGNKTKEQEFILTKTIVEAVKFFHDREPQRVEEIKREVDNYFGALDRLHLNDYLLRSFNRKRSVFLNSIFTFLFLVLGFPLFVFGFINNYLPYKIPYFIARAITSDKGWYGAIFITSGLIMFILFYPLQIYLATIYIHNLWYTIAYVILLPISGFFAWTYYRRFTNVRGKWLVFSLFYNRAHLISGLIQQREMIIRKLEEARKEFNQMREVFSE